MRLSRLHPKAVKVPASETGTIPPSAFLAVPRLRHVIVEEGMHTVGALAWQNCRQLRIVKLPNTVVRIDESAFRGCDWQNSITAVAARTSVIRLLLTVVRYSRFFATAGTLQCNLKSPPPARNGKTRRCGSPHRVNGQRRPFSTTPGSGTESRGR